MTLPEGSFDKFWNDVVVRNFPKAKIRYKDESWLFKHVLKYVFFFKKTFMTTFTTVIGNTIYFPSRGWRSNRSDKKTIATVAHEMIHMWDKRADKKFGIDWFSLRYLLPQGLVIFSLLALFAFINLWFLLFLWALLFLIPWPANYRSEYEARGYAMSFYCWGLNSGEQYNVEEDIAWAVGIFTDGSYYWMNWGPANARRILEKHYETLPKTHAAFKEVGEWLKTQQT